MTGLLLLLALTPTRAGAQSGEPAALILTPATGPDGKSYIEIENPRWPGNVWQLRLPEYISVTEANRDISSLVRPALNPRGLVIRGIDHQSGLSYSFVLFPDVDAVIIRGVFHNTTNAPLPTEAYASSCLSFLSAPDFRDPTPSPPLAVFGRQLKSITQAFGGEGSPLPRSASLILREQSNAVPPHARINASLIVKSSVDGKRHVGMAWSNAWSVGFEMNRDADCIHSSPNFGVVGPRQRCTAVGRIYLVEGDADAVYREFLEDFPGMGYGEWSATTMVDEEGIRIEGRVEDRNITVSVKADSSRDGRVVRLHRTRVAHRGGGGDDTSFVVASTTLSRNVEFVYTEAEVDYGDVHEFWISEDERESKRITVRVRDPELWWGMRRVDEETDRIAERFARRVRVRRHGETTQGWPLRSLSAGNPDSMIVVVGGIHAAESGPEIIVPVFEAIVRDQPAALDKVGITVLPLVNADTRQRLIDGYPSYLRKNANGVDINRNFDAFWYDAQHKYGRATSDPTSPTYKGKQPESERETQAVVDFIGTTRPLAVISIHSPGGLLLAPNKATQELMSRCRDVGSRFAASHLAASESSTRGAGVRPEPMPGTLPAWIAVAYDVPAFDQESDMTPECKALNQHVHTRKDLDTLRARNYNSLLTLLTYFAGESP